MIVMIIAVSVLAFTPGFSRAMADRRVGLATRELIRIGRRARADTFGYLRAHLLWIKPGTGTVAGTVQLLRGPTNSCALTAWNTVAADCATNLATSRCVESLQLANESGSTRVITLREEAVDGSITSYSSLNRALCFQPSGVMMTGSGGTDPPAGSALVEMTAGVVAGGYVFALVSGADPPGTNAAQKVHRVLFPQGGSPRSLR